MATLAKVKTASLSDLFISYPRSTVTDTGDIVVKRIGDSVTCAAKLFGKHFLVDKSASEWYLILGEYSEDGKLTYTGKQYVHRDLCEVVKEWELV